MFSNNNIGINGKSQQKCVASPLIVSSESELEGLSKLYTVPKIFTVYFVLTYIIVRTIFEIFNLMAVVGMERGRHAIYSPFRKLKDLSENYFPTAVGWINILTAQSGTEPSKDIDDVLTLDLSLWQRQVLNFKATFASFKENPFAGDGPYQMAHNLWEQAVNLCAKFHLHKIYTTIDEYLSWCLEEVSELSCVFKTLKDGELCHDCLLFFQMLVTYGVCRPLVYVYKEITIFEVDELPKKPSFYAIVTQGFAVLQRVCEALLRFARSGKALSLLKNDREVQFQGNYSTLVTDYAKVECGADEDLCLKFDGDLAKCLAECERMLVAAKAPDRARFTGYLVQLKKMSVSRMLQQKEQLRMKPYGVLLYGPPGTGKSALVMPLVHFMVEQAGGSGDPSRCIVMNPEDKFQSEYTSNMEGVVIDDMCQMNVEHMVVNPHAVVIQFLNNVPVAALMAEAEKKGKVMIRPLVVAVTTNVKDLKAPELSNAPSAILRRFDVIITQKVREEYCKPGTGMVDPALIGHMSGNQFPDYAEFTVETAHAVENTTGNTYGGAHRKPPEVLQFTPVEFNGEKLVNIRLPKLLEFLQHDIKKQRAQQSAFVNTQRRTDHPKCVHGMPSCACQKCIDESLAGLKSFFEDHDSAWDISDPPEEELDAQMSIPYYTDVLDFLYSLETEFVNLGNMLLQYLLTLTCVRNYFYCYLIGHIKQECMQSFKYYALVVFMLAFNEHTFGGSSGRQIIVVSLLYAAWMYAEWCRLERELKARFTMPRPSDFIKKHKLLFQGIGIALALNFGVWSILVLMARTWKHLSQQSGVEEITEIPDNKFATVFPGGKPWLSEKAFWDAGTQGANRMIDRSLVSSASEHTSLANLRAIVSKRLYKAYNEQTGEHFNVLPVKGNVFIIPGHVVSDVEYDITIIIKGQYIRGCKVSRTMSHALPNSDIAFLYVPNVPPQKDLSRFFAKGKLDGKILTGHLIFNNGSEIVHYPSMSIEMKDVVSTKAKFFGGRYLLATDTFFGMCGGVVAAETRDTTATRLPFLFGIHLAGKDKVGAAGFVTQADIEDALYVLNKRSFIMTEVSESPLPVQSMGVVLPALVEPHPKCVTRELGNQSMITVLGGIEGHMSNRKTQVTRSKISQAVEEIMGITVQHKVPEDLNARIHRSTSIQTKSQPATNYDSEMLQRAYEDFDEQLKCIPSSEYDQLGKLQNDNIVSGMDGVIGINGLNLQTAVGYPLSGSKSRYFPVSERKVDGITCVYEIDQVILDEMARIEDELASGNRCNTVFTCAVKDEAVKKTKNVSRIFVGANAPMTMIVRKYYLSICAMIQRNSRLTECAAGVVVQSPQWGELFEHLSGFGEDRMIAGDYKSFDSTMGAVILKAAFKLMVGMAEHSGRYTLRDLKIMRGLADEITYATVNCFNTLIVQAGTNPSGHALTVQTNSFVNSLMLRYAYFIASRNARIEKPLRFDDVAKATTYGDDNVIGVKEGHDYFNHTTIAEILGDVGVEYTMADKEAETRPYINLSEVSFLKHYAVKDPETGFWRCPCEPGSLAKMLHFHRKSAVLTENESCAESLQNAALKFFEFGEEVYTERREQMLRVAEVGGIMGDLVGLPTYAELDTWYREKFDL